MPRLLDYPTTLQTLQSQGLKSLYYNSGAFGFPTPPSYVGWIGPDDPTLRPQVLPFALRIPSPYPPTLASLALEAWQTLLRGGPAWVMPMSHWAYELDFGSHDWLPHALHALNLDPTHLQPLTTGNAIEFPPDDAPLLHTFLEQLLQNLKMSDFMLAFPGRRTLCTIHHHQQLWWSTDDPTLPPYLRHLAEPSRTQK